MLDHRACCLLNSVDLASLAVSHSLSHPASCSLSSKMQPIKGFAELPRGTDDLLLLSFDFLLIAIHSPNPTLQTSA